MAPKKKSKGPDDFAKDEAVKINNDLLAVETGEQRDAIYKKYGTTKQMWIQVSKTYNLTDLPKAKPGKVKKKAIGATKASATKPTTQTKVEPKKRAPVAKQPSKPKNSTLDQDIRDLIALQAKVIGQLIGK